MTTKQVTDELAAVGEKVSQWTVGRILERRRLKACCPRQTALLQPQHLKVCVSSLLKITLILILEENSMVWRNKNRVIWSQWCATCLEGKWRSTSDKEQCHYSKA